MKMGNVYLFAYEMDIDPVFESLAVSFSWVLAIGKTPGHFEVQ